jgi:Fe-S oxidoreductase
MSRTEQLPEPVKRMTDRNNGVMMARYNSCVHCGLCAESCLYYLATGDAKMIPARKVELVNALYRRYGTFTGRHFPWLVGARPLDDKMMEEMTDLLFGACTMCGRCVTNCSVGVDIAGIVRDGRTILARNGMVPATLQSTVDAALNTGNNMAIPDDEFLDTIEWMAEELADELADPEARIPVNERGKNVLYTLNPREPKFFPLSIAAMAKIFYAAGETFTLSTKMYDVTNYAFFSANVDEAAVIALRLVDEMGNMEAKRCVLAECGHGSRAFRWEAPNYLKQHFGFDVLTSVELIHEYVTQGRIKLEKGRLTGTYTMHDPCNLVRFGGVIKPQREVLNLITDNFVEMTPCGTDNYCCGGGGGQLAMSEYNERRMMIGAIKADQIRATGADTVVTPCHNCVDQLMQINSHFKLGIQIKTLAEVVADALIIE